MALNVGTQLGHYSVTALIGEGVLEFAEHILTNAARLWVELGIDGKQDLQQVLSPQGLSFDRQEFGTAVTSLTFKHCEALRPTGTDVASPSVPIWNQWPLVPERDKRAAKVRSISGRRLSLHVVTRSAGATVRSTVAPSL